jgi:integrase
MSEQRRYRLPGEGNIRERANGTWEARARLDGKSRSFYGKTHKEALHKLREGQRLASQGRLPDTKGQTVAAYLKAWLAEVRHSIRPETLRSYRLNVERVSPYIGRARLDALKPAQVSTAYTRLLDSGLSKRSVQQCGVVLHKALSDALRQGLVSHNAADLAQKPRPERTEQRTLSAEQLVHLLETTTGDRYHALWVLLGTAGLRLGEALGLKWADVDLPKRTLTVQRALQRQAGRGLVFVEPKSKGSRRTVELLDIAVDALKAHKDRQDFQRARAERVDRYDDQDLVFASATGTPLEQGGVWKHWRAALDKANLPPIRRHDLRHTAATLRLQAGANVKVVQELLGHSSITLTLDTYSHVTPGMQRESADAMDTILRAKMGTHAS